MDQEKAQEFLLLMFQILEKRPVTLYYYYYGLYGHRLTLEQW